MNVAVHFYGLMILGLTLVASDDTGSKVIGVLLIYAAMCLLGWYIADKITGRVKK